MASSTTTASFIYKRKYADRRPAELAMRFHPVLQILKKQDGFVGHDTNGSFFYAVRYANPQGVSGSFSNAQSQASSGGASSGVQFQAARRTKYGVINLDGPSLRAAKGNDGAFLNLVTMESEGIFDEVGDSLAFEAHRDGTGARGRRSSLSSDTVTLTVADDARNFKVGMTVIASPNSDGSSPRSGSTTVAAVDEDAGTVELTSAAAITSFADNDYLFRQGDPTTCVDGFESIIPLTAPVFGSDSFRGVDRGADARRLSGVRTNDTNTSIEENAGLTAVKISQLGKRSSHLLLNPIKFWEVVRRLNAKVEYEGGGGEAGYGFETFMIHTPAGSLKAVSDPDAPTNRGRVINAEDWCWKHLGSPWIHSITDDKGGFFLRKDGSDAIEGRVVCEGNILCWAPGSNGVFAI